MGWLFSDIGRQAGGQWVPERQGLESLSFLPKGAFCPQLMKSIEAERRSEEMGTGELGPAVRGVGPGKRTGRDCKEKESTNLHRGSLSLLLNLNPGKYKKSSVSRAGNHKGAVS